MLLLHHWNVTFNSASVLHLPPFSKERNKMKGNTYNTICKEEGLGQVWCMTPLPHAVLHVLPISVCTVLCTPVRKLDPLLRSWLPRSHCSLFGSGASCKRTRSACNSFQIPVILKVCRSGMRKCMHCLLSPSDWLPLILRQPTANHWERAGSVNTSSHSPLAHFLHQINRF